MLIYNKKFLILFFIFFVYNCESILAMEESKKNPFDILGISRDSSDEQVKKAFLKLAAKWHPDKNNNSPESTARFAEFSNARDEILNGTFSSSTKVGSDMESSDDLVEELFRNLFEDLLREQEENRKKATNFGSTSSSSRPDSSSSRSHFEPGFSWEKPTKSKDNFSTGTSTRTGESKFGSTSSSSRPDSSSSSFPFEPGFSWEKPTKPKDNFSSRTSTTTGESKFKTTSGSSQPDSSSSSSHFEPGFSWEKPGKSKSTFSSRTSTPKTKRKFRAFTPDPTSSSSNDEETENPYFSSSKTHESTGSTFSSTSNSTSSSSRDNKSNFYTSSSSDRSKSNRNAENDYESKKNSPDRDKAYSSTRDSDSENDSATDDFEFRSSYSSRYSSSDYAELRDLRTLYLPKCILLDVINYVHEFYRIKNLGSTKKAIIKKVSSLNKFFHLCSILFTPVRIINQYKQYKINKSDRSPLGIVARIANILPSIAAFKFYALDNYINSKAKIIAKLNKKSQIDFNNKKIIQRTWLTLNKIIPYLGFIYSRIKHDHANKDMFSPYNIGNSDGKSTNVMMILRSFANISEIFRKSYLYKAELSSLKNKKSAKTA